MALVKWTLTIVSLTIQIPLTSWVQEQGRGQAGAGGQPLPGTKPQQQHREQQQVFCIMANNSCCETSFMRMELNCKYVECVGDGDGAEDDGQDEED